MAKTKASIYMNYNLAIKQASELEKIASDLDHLATNNFQSCMNQVSSHWEGENSKAYLKKGTLLQSKVTTTAKDIRKAASTIRTIAKNTYDAEMRALAIAQTKSS